jgi:hypothetical protein
MRLPSPHIRDAAAEAIAIRRAACGDDGLEQLGDDPRSVIRYVLAHRQVPKAVLAQDVADVLALILSEQADLTRALHDTMSLARSPEVGMTWADVARLVGLRSAQGAMQLYQRLGAERRGGPRSEVHWRQLRREARWVAARAAQIDAAARRVARAGPAGDMDFDALRDALDDPEASAATVMVWLRIAVRGLLAAGRIGADDPVARLVHEWESLGPRRRGSGPPGRAAGARR